MTTQEKLFTISKAKVDVSILEALMEKERYTNEALFYCMSTYRDEAWINIREMERLV